MVMARQPAAGGAARGALQPHSAGLLHLHSCSSCSKCQKLQGKHPLRGSSRFCWQRATVPRPFMPRVDSPRVQPRPVARIIPVRELRAFNTVIAALKLKEQLAWCQWGILTLWVPGKGTEQRTGEASPGARWGTGARAVPHPQGRLWRRRHRVPARRSPVPCVLPALSDPRAETEVRSQHCLVYSFFSRGLCLFCCSCKNNFQGHR